MNLSKFLEIVKERGACAVVHVVSKDWTQLSDLTTTTDFPAPVQNFYF